MKKMLKIVELTITVLCTVVLISCDQTKEEEMNSYDIVFYSGHTGNNEIFKMDEHGDNLVNVSDNPADDNSPTASPDGTMIAFVSNRDGVDNIYKMTIEGKNVEKITDSTTNLTQPCWSPDGTKILYTVDYATYTEIWVMDIDGANNTQITFNKSRDERPVFSPDMTKILFMSNREGRYKIYVMDADGSNQEKITVSEVNNDYHFVFPQWNPDGHSIIYSLNDLANRKATIHIVQIDGLNDIVLTEEDGRNENPSWSSDGKWIVFQSERDGNFEIYKMRSDGTDVTRLTNRSGWDGWPSFVERDK